MPLRSKAGTIGALCGNDMLDRADAFVRDLRIADRFHQDARQEVVLAELEGRDPKRAVRRYIQSERVGGRTGDNTRPGKDQILSLNDPELDALASNPDAETNLARRELQLRREQIADALWIRLRPREQEIVKLRAMGWTQKDIGDHLGITQQAVAKAQLRIQAKTAA